MPAPARILTPEPDRWRHLRRPAILAQIGNTPLLKLEKVTAGLRPEVAVYVKAEWFNPGGSIKDRPALRMIEQAERRGELTPAKTIIDATSGNTGIGYALVGAAKGYRVTLVMPENVTVERKQLARAYGAELIFSDPLEGSDGAIRLVRELVAAHPDRYYYPNQYDNDENWKAHYYGTAAEIWQQTRGRVTHFLAGIGTSGTFVGVSRRLKRDMPHVKCISAQPSSGFHGLEGLKHMPTALVPAIYDPTLADGNEWVETEDAYRMVRRLAREEGLLVGLSSGANVVAVRQAAARLVER
ncbi:MAG: cysteine synthase family protein, partial [Caldilineales bacterium]|nr:cysteine synthase family protein [Caldilineales bacterium]